MPANQPLSAIAGTVNIVTAGKPEVLRVRNTALHARLPNARLPGSGLLLPGSGGIPTFLQDLEPTGY